MDIKEKIDEITGKIKGDKDLGEKFRNDPVKTVEGLIGIDLPDDQIKGIADAVKAKIDLGGIGEKLGGLFGKK